MKRRASKRKAKAAPRVARARQPGSSSGWRTTDADELELRAWRAERESMRVERLAEAEDPFDSYRVISASGERYIVEIRSLDLPINSCECRDHEINRLGTCKHVEAVRRRLRRRGAKALAEAASLGSRRVELFLDPREHRIRVLWPRRRGPRLLAERRLARFFRADATLRTAQGAPLAALYRVIDDLPAAARERLRISHCLAPWLERERRLREQTSARQAFEDRLARDPSLLDLIKVPLYPYQTEGVLHLAFTQRALLADEMGLGKTAQSIAACMLLKQLRGIRRVLVVTPASLKAEWEEQIAHFCDLDAQPVYGSRSARLEHYRQPAFFTLVNYEQVRSDVKDIQELLVPDVVILDEAQRIKNWRTRTAASVKQLRSRYAFVLTGTPLENRIDEIYSIVEFLDPHIFGPLFRFNRDFYELDERGRPVGYVNLDELNRRLQPVMLRRRKSEVEGELPARSIKTYYVPMSDEQRARYDEYSGHVARILARAKRRPLTPEEFERLQQFLACMRMLCDTPYILDPKLRESPKLDELAGLLTELLETPGRKVIVFSEWERMLELVRDHAQGAGIGHAWHTGSVPQKKRRAQINRFKDDPQCRLFLSTDSGSVGLNLQVADVVVNVDQPWNPARLEQRIARAWRKHQTRPVLVVNLVAEDSIEQRMLGVLEGKRLLADSVVDGSSDIKAMQLPSGRAAFVQRLQQLTGAPCKPAKPPSERRPKRAVGDEVRDLLDDAVGRGKARVRTLTRPDTQPTVLAAVDRLDAARRGRMDSALDTVRDSRNAVVEILDESTLTALGRLAALGLIELSPEVQGLMDTVPSSPGAPADPAPRLAEARARAQGAARSRAVAGMLAEGGFLPEAVKPAREAAAVVLDSLAWAAGIEDRGAVSAAAFEKRIVGPLGLPADLPGWVGIIGEDDEAVAEDRAHAVLAAAHKLFEAADAVLR